MANCFFDSSKWRKRGLALILALSSAFGIAAQDDPDTVLDKPKARKTAKKVQETPKAAPKLTPRTATAAQVRKPDPPKPAKKAEPPPKKKAAPARTNGRFIKVTFKAPEIGLELEIDEKGGFYIPAKLETEIPLTAGKHNIVVKRNGQPVTDILQLTVSRDQYYLDLAPYLKDFQAEEEPEESKIIMKPSEKAAEEEKEKPYPKIEEPTPPKPSAQVSAASQLVEQNVRSIIDRYKDPKHTDSVSLKDWEYVYQNALLPDNMPSFRKEQLTLLMAFSEGQINLLQGRTPDAINSFSAAVTLSKALKDVLESESPLNYYGYGNAYYAARQYQRAVNAYLEAIKIDPSLPMPYKRLGDSLVALGRSKEAIGYHLKALEMGYGGDDTALKLAQSLKDAGNIDESLKIFEKLARDNPSSAAYIGIGDCYAAKKLFYRALDSYRKAAEIDGKSALAYYRIGLIYYDSGDYHLCIDSLEKAIGLDPASKVISKAYAEKIIGQAKAKKK